MQILTDQDADLSFLDNQTIAVLGFGSQGSAQAFMLRASGLRVVVGARVGGRGYLQAQADGFEVLEIAEACKVADIIHILLPDEVQAKVFNDEIFEVVGGGAKTISFSSGFNIAEGLIVPPKNVDVVLVAPIAPGNEAKKLYLEDKGVPAYVAVHQNYSGRALEVALALAKAMKFTKAGVMKVTFRQETVTDLFGEQVVVCGGLVELVRNAFDTLVEAGYPQEMAYFECFHQVELLARLLKEKGIGGMWKEVSNTAEFGARLTGPKIIGAPEKKAMQAVLKEIEQGNFAKSLVDEFSRGLPKLNILRRQDASLPIEIVGEKIRKQLRGEI